MKKTVVTFLFILFIAFFVFVKSCVISNPKPEECVTVTAQISDIVEGTSYDIVFHTTDDNRYYINRGLEQGLNLDSLNAAVLNKTVILQLPKLLFGPTKHISELKVGDDIIFTEFD